MRAGWNEMTEKILAVVSVKPGLTAQKISKALKTGETKISTILLRLKRAGHVSRVREQDGEVVIDADEGITRPKYVYKYSITSNGDKRLGWIRENGHTSRRRQ